MQDRSSRSDDINAEWNADDFRQTRPALEVLGMSNRREAIIVPCTQETELGSVLASEAYTKPVFSRWRKHAEQAGHPWFILSTKYGLLRPDQPIERYNVSVSRAVADPALRRLLNDQARALGLVEHDVLTLLDWEKFEPLVRAAVPDPKVKCALRKIAY